ncbi:unnamed protein product [Candida verbasci]|uniref:Ca3427-like PBP 2 domain-containing protein n=1 Tax=Candida verbasci TaxID=1227364 RepID=A0A9W4TTB7_9ASCO|nr:unnamed protein product [Candida verbasci]
MASTTLRVAYVPEHFSTPLFLAEKQGYYLNANLKIEFTPVKEGSGKLIQLLNSNEIDIAIGLTEAFIANIGQGNDKIKLLDTYVLSPLLWAISTGYNRDELKSASDLNEASNVGISRYGSGSYIMSFVLAQEQLKLQSGFSNFNELSNFLNLRNAVNSKDADFFMWEYFTSKKYYDNKEIKKIGEIYTPWPSWVITSTSKIYNEDKESLKKFINAVFKGINYFNEHKEESIEYIYNNFDYSKEDAQEWIKTVKFNYKLGSEGSLNYKEIVENTSDILKIAGVLKDSDEVIESRLRAHVISN